MSKITLTLILGVLLVTTLSPIAAAQQSCVRSCRSQLDNCLAGIAVTIICDEIDGYITADECEQPYRYGTNRTNW